MASTTLSIDTSDTMISAHNIWDYHTPVGIMLLHNFCILFTTHCIFNQSIAYQRLTIYKITANISFYSLFYL